MKISYLHYFKQLIILLVMAIPFLKCSVDEPSPYVEYNITANTLYGVKIFLDINSDGEDDIEFTGGKSSSPGGYQNENYNINILNPDYRILVKSRKEPICTYEYIFDSLPAIDSKNCDGDAGTVIADSTYTSPVVMPGDTIGLNGFFSNSSPLFFASYYGYHPYYANPISHLKDIDVSHGIFLDALSGYILLENKSGLRQRLYYEFHDYFFSILQLQPDN
ncbi:MAG: hypothetical protein KA954_12245 [Chitinophagales bacterium]|nr:hypothetical protein [Chitinophagales bacterium]MBP9705613.1 hypothetical protein [Chitinophagales bacterium]